MVRLIGITKTPMIMPATSVKKTAAEYLPNLTIRKQMASEAKMIAKYVII